MFTDVGIAVYAHTFHRGSAPLLRNISITGNRFNWPAGRAIALGEAVDLHATNNRFEAASAAPAGHE